MTNRISHRIDGKAWAGEPERSGEVYDPASGSVTSTVDFASISEVAEAVSAASRALPAWRNASLAARTRVLFAFRELLSARKDELAKIITSEHGKVESDAAGEIARAIENVEYACGAAPDVERRLQRARRPGSTCTRCSSRSAWSA